MHAHSTFLQKAQVTRKLDCVAKSLFGMDKDAIADAEFTGPARNLPVPFTYVVLVALHKPVLISGPTTGEVTHEQGRKAEVHRSFAV